MQRYRFDSSQALTAQCQLKFGAVSFANRRFRRTKQKMKHKQNVLTIFNLTNVANDDLGYGNLNHFATSNYRKLVFTFDLVLEA